jgi:AcrR family transcriptional regulator
LTRQRLIESAIQVFADVGYDAARTRAIVRKASTNLISIPYYFGSKLGLYNAAAEHIANNIAEKFRPIIEQAETDLLQRDVTHYDVLESFIRFIENFAATMLGVDTPEVWGQFISREQFQPCGALNIIHSRTTRFIDVGCEYVSRLTGWQSNSDETRVQLLLVLSMAKLPCIDRASMLRTMNWQSIGDQESRLLACTLRRNVQALFTPSGQRVLSSCTACEPANCR